MPSAIKTDDFADFQKYLIGTWENFTFPGTNVGGPDNPLSYNIMPLPQASPSGPGYILKNFTYYETVRFNSNMDESAEVALSVLAPNRGGTYTQDSRALFYSQQVHFAEGPAAVGPTSKSVVHVENGAWLYLYTVPQQIGPYAYPPANPATEPGPVLPQPPDITIAKQMSVPHGNQILALGKFDEVTKGAPEIPDAPSPLPTPPGLNTTPYTTLLNNADDYENPQPKFTKNWNLPLQMTVEAIKPDSFLHWSVTTDLLPSGQGGLMNIPFENRKAQVVRYFAAYWLLSTNSGNSFDYLAYTQNIVLSITIGGQKYIFPHGTANTVTRT